MSDHNSSVATIKPLPSSSTLPAAVRAVNPVIFCHPISFMVALADVGESTGVIGINGGAVAALSMPPPQTTVSRRRPSMPCPRYFYPDVSTQTISDHAGSL